MSDYYESTITNWFSVTDENEYKNFTKGLWSLDGYSLELNQVNHNGKIQHWFGSQSLIGWRDPDKSISDDYEPDFDALCRNLSKLIAPDDACIIEQIRQEGLRYFTAYATVVYHGGWRQLNFEDYIRDFCRDNLNIDKVNLMY